MIVLQKNVTRDIIGIANALSSIQKETVLWDPSKDNIKEINNITTVIINDVSTIGYQTGIPKAANVILLNIDEVPKVFKDKKNCILVKLPLCADNILYPPGYFVREYECDISYISNFIVDKRPYVQGTLGFIPSKKYKIRIAGSVPLNVVPYMGPIQRENIIKLCRSSKLCIDFDFNIAIDLIYHGCHVITNIENDYIPSFDESNIMEVIAQEINKSQPIINELKDKAGIITYQDYLTSMLEYIH